MELSVNVSVNAGLWIIFKNFIAGTFAASRWLRDVVLLPSQDLPPSVCQNVFWSVFATVRVKYTSLKLI